jgi:hypothetical protein
MAVQDKIKTFIDEYRTKLESMNQKLSEASTRASDLGMEINYINQAELPQAIEKRVLEGDSAMENRLRKTLEKLQAECQDKQETVLVLTNAIQRYKMESANEITSLERLFRDEKRIIEDKAFSSMAKHKGAYITALKNEAEALHSYQVMDSKIQNIKENGGRTPLFTGIEIPYTMDLTVPRNDVVKYVKGL